MRPLALLVIPATLALAACSDKDGSRDGGPDTSVGDGDGADGGATDSGATDSGAVDPGAVDDDGDGVTADQDCDDDDPSVHPGADELCNDVDDDCDGQTDEDATDAVPWYADADGDGFGDREVEVLACAAPRDDDRPTHVSDATDCDDGDPSVHPGAFELCNDVDDDCDPTTGAEGLATWDPAEGAAEDWTDLLTGTEDRGVTLTLTDDGTLWFCEGTHFVNVEAEATVTVRGHAADPRSVVLDGTRRNPVLRVEGYGRVLTARELTATNGSGGVDGTLHVYMGGGAQCRDPEKEGTALVLDTVWITESEAPYGGGVGTLGCDTDFTDVTIEENVASISGGATLHWEGDHRWEGVTLRGNVGEQSVGGSYWTIWRDPTPMQVDLDEVRFIDNTGPLVGGVGWTYADVVWTGTGESASGAQGNRELGGGGAAVQHAYGSTFVADLLDFGSAGSADDNHPADFEDDITGDAFPLAEDVSFACDFKGCAQDGSATLGAEGTWVHGTDTVLNSVLAEYTGTLDAVRAYVDADSACALEWFVYTSGDGPGDSGEPSDWTLQWFDTTTVADGTAWQEAHPDLILSEGVWYAVGIGSACAVGHAWDTSSGTDTDAGFGTTGGALRADRSAERAEEATFVTVPDDARLFMQVDYGVLTE